jgi:hypothetical protein
VSQAAEALHTSQSGVSKACQLLEEELNLQIFQRHGKRLIGITEPATIILNLAERIMDASHLFPPSTTYLGVRRDAFLRGYMYEFIQLLAPQFDRNAVDAALK